MTTVWVPLRPVADAINDIPDVKVDIYGPGDDVPPSVDEVEFYVPAFFPTGHALEVIPRMPRLRVIQTLTAGIDLLLPYVPPGVTLCNARGAHDPSTAEWVVGAILAALHDFPRFAVAQHEGRWDFRFTDSLAGKTVLIVGYGSIGAAVERRLAGFDVEIRRSARRARAGVAAMSETAELLPAADVVVILVPVTEETIGMVDAAFLSRMKDGALLVNAARGSIVDTAALTAELTAGRLRAALDVTDPEPLPAGHPLWRAPGLLLTPHVAGSTPISASRALGLVRDQLQRYISGQDMQNVISGNY